MGKRGPRGALRKWWGYIPARPQAIAPRPHGRTMYLRGCRCKRCCRLVAQYNLEFSLLEDDVRIQKTLQKTLLETLDKEADIG